MGTHLSIAGKHTFSADFEQDKIVSLAYRIADSFIKKFNLNSEERRLESFEIHLNMNLQNPFLHFYIDCIGNGIWLYVYRDAFVINSYYKFHHFVYDAKAGTAEDAGFFKDFRKDIFEMVQLLNCHRIIYLCDEFSGRELANFSSQLSEGASFDEVELALIKQYGKPISELDKINKDGDPYNFYDRLHEFVVDDFSDFSKKEK